ncbi:hypothetical protein BOTBODRAFT_408983 [Botryobasidium botryosum FD-172 SS1]|uniref:Protein kinase domain-containing protein n=1 Tax=Botryobasidium botryosum (strain FD-172 SS1) TaxID=930990 RepID=A0A067MAD3_BOTB1|nr:hypothetical protein BOTBODRAFT_408983 [Botryobasidium botryosum FD-172 SS1]
MFSDCRVRFGVLFSGKQMQIFHVRQQETLPRPYLVVSDPMSVTAVNPSPVQLIFYMLLAAHNGAPPLPSYHMETMITLPPHTSSSSISIALLTRGTQAQCPEITICFDIAGVPDPPVYNLSRAEPTKPRRAPDPTPPPQASASLQSDNASTATLASAKIITLTQRLGSGASGTAYAGTDRGGTRVVAKFARRDTTEDVLRESWFYQYKLAPLHGLVVPMYYGVFCGDRRAVLLTAYAGKSLASFDGLDDKARQTILDHVIALHHHGVYHNDVRPENITIDLGGRLRVIDLSHATIHTCPGVDNCSEIIKVARVLGLSNILGSYLNINEALAEVQ